jgi:hypothetical protein
MAIQILVKAGTTSMFPCLTETFMYEKQPGDLLLASGWFLLQKCISHWPKWLVNGWSVGDAKTHYEAGNKKFFAVMGRR